MDKTIKIMLIVVVILGIFFALRITVFKEVEFNNKEIATEDTVTEEVEYNVDRQEIIDGFSVIETQGTILDSDELWVVQNEMEPKIIAILVIVVIVFIILPTVGIWKIFQNSGVPGFYAIIPILSTVKLCSIVGISGWFILVGLIPGIGTIGVLILNIVICYRLAKMYDKSIGYVLGLLFLPFIFYPLLGFSQSVTKRKNIVTY